MAEHFDFQKITTFAFDVDGVFTNSEVLVTETGELLRTMNTRDGQAVKFALEAGFRVGIFTKGFSLGVRKRFEMLGVHDIYDKLTDKVPSFLEYIHINQLQRE